MSLPARVGLRAIPTSRRLETDLEALLIHTQTPFFTYDIRDGGVPY